MLKNTKNYQKHKNYLGFLGKIEARTGVLFAVKTFATDLCAKSNSK